MNHHPGKKALCRAIVILSLLIFWIGDSCSPVIFGQRNLAERWHPTRIPSGAAFIGDQACAECHQDLARLQAQRSMGLAMDPVPESKLLIANPKMVFQNGDYAYEIARQQSQSFYTVTNGRETVTLPILYAFGQGKAGQTYLLQYDGEFYESRVSFYNQVKGLDLTIGHSKALPGSLKEAVGRRLPKDETLRCFNCHSTGAVKGNQLQLDQLRPGIRCEACHGPGGEHVAAAKAGQPNAKLIFNPARLNGDELTQNFCASCHSTTDELSVLRGLGINNIRHQPYRIFKSKCYSDDRKISCTACHNPHESLKTETADYDAKCLACHTANRRPVKGRAKPAAAGSIPGCRIGNRNCASCHMPQIELPGSHFKFTDHYIRIVKPNEAYQN